MTTIYQIYQNNKKDLYKFSEKIKSNNLYKTVLDLYSSRKLKSDYIGIFNSDIKIKHNFEFKLDQITNDYDMYIAPFGVNTRHSVFNKLYNEFPYLYDIVINKLLSYLKISAKLKPKLGIYDNSVIAKKEIYKDYIKNYLKPSIYFLDLLNIDQTIKNNILDLLWSIYYENNKKNIKLKIFRNQLIKKSKNINNKKSNILVTVVDLQKHYTLKNTIFNYDYCVVKYVKRPSFKTNLNITFTEYFYKVDKTNVLDILKLNNILINDIRYSIDIFKYDLIVYSNNYKILENKNVSDFIDLTDMINNNSNELFMLKYDNTFILYGKPNIMELFFELSSKKKYHINDLAEYIKYAIKKMGIKISEIVLSDL